MVLIVRITDQMLLDKPILRKEEQILVQLEALIEVAPQLTGPTVGQAEAVQVSLDLPVGQEADQVSQAHQDPDQVPQVEADHRVLECQVAALQDHLLLPGAQVAANPAALQDAIIN